MSKSADDQVAIDLVLDAYLNKVLTGAEAVVELRALTGYDIRTCFLIIRKALLSAKVNISGTLFDRQMP